MMLLQTVLEGLGLGALLCWVCAVGKRKGALGMVHLYSAEVQTRCVALGLTTRETIRRNALALKVLSLPLYLGYLFLCVFGINRARGFFAIFRQSLVMLSVMNLVDRFLIDGLWVAHTRSWVIAGTEDLMPYITRADKRKKWLAGTLGMAALAALLALLGALIQ